jgi:molybdate transport system substrate-binding protein
MSAPLSGFCSMATQHLLAELIPKYRAGEVKLESVSGLEAAARVRAGQACDFVVLAADAIAKLEAEGHVVAGSRADIANAGIAVAVREGTQPPDLSTELAFRSAIDRAKKIGYSTGPSGVYLLKLFEGWGIERSRLVQAPPGVAVATLVANGDVDIGLQQLSEMIHSHGITVAGLLPPGAQLVTTFSGAVCTKSARSDATRSLLAHFASKDHDEDRRRHGLLPTK